MKKVLKFILIILLITSCSNNVYVDQRKKIYTSYEKPINKNKIKRKSRNYDVCNILKRNHKKSSKNKYN